VAEVPYKVQKVDNMIVAYCNYYRKYTQLDNIKLAKDHFTSSTLMLLKIVCITPRIYIIIAITSLNTVSWQINIECTSSKSGISRIQND
jgi:hypothetical protein